MSSHGWYVLLAVLTVVAPLATGSFLHRGDVEAPTPEHAPSSGYSAVAWSDPFDDDEVIERNDEGVGA